MSDHDLILVRARLENLLTELVDANTSAKASAATVDLDQSRVGRLSRMDALQNQAISQSALAKREQAIRQAKSALRRVDSGDYGFCVECEQAVDHRRLNHNPAAAMCIQCAERAERG